MSNKLICRMLLFAAFSLSILTACENDDNSIEVNEETSQDVFVIPKVNNDSTVLFINTSEDLHQTLAKVADEREKSLLQRGWIRVGKEPMTRGGIKAKQQVRTDTVYVSQETVDYYSDPSVYANFNARFSKSMVDSINRVVSSEYRIS